MQDYRLRIGMRFIWQGKEYEIAGRINDTEIRIRDISSDTCSPQAIKTLLDELFEGRLELIGEEDYRSVLKQRLRKSGVTDLSVLEDDHPLKAEIIRRFHYLDEILRTQPRPRTKPILTPIILTVSRRIEDPNPPSWITVNRWLKTFENAGCDIRSLAPAYKARGNRQPKFSGKILSEFSEEEHEKAMIVLGIVERVIRTKYLSKERPTVQSIHEMLTARIIEENKYRDVHDHLPAPHISSLYKIIGKLDQYEVDSARYGKSYADKKYRTNKQGPRPARPLERVECDHTKVDLMVVDTETRLPLGRPWLTTLIDVHTKMILGMYLGFHRTGALSVMQCLLHAIRPKTYLKTDYPMVENDWPTYGIPELIVVDNGKEFHSKHFKDACRQIGMGWDYSPPKCAWYRPTVERFFGTIGKSLLHQLPGTTFSNIFEKGDYDPRKHAIISLNKLLEIIHIWIVDRYHKRIHKGIRDIPYRRWTAALADYSPNLPPSSIELEVLIGFVEHRCVGPSGVELFTLLYNSSELGLVRRYLEKGEKVLVKYDPTNISLIYVWDKVNNRFVAVPALDQEYTRNLSAWQHHVIKRYAYRFIKSHLDIEALCRAKERIQQIIEEERLLKNKVGRTQTIAHFLNIGQPNYHKSSANPSLSLHAQSLGSQNNQLLNNQFLSAEISSDDLKGPEQDSGWSADYDLPIDL